MSKTKEGDFMEIVRGFFPDELKNLPQWVLWRLTPEGKKEPYSANYDGRASTTNRNSWASYNKAVARFERGGFDGIGFVFCENDGLSFVDVDHCVIDGKPNDLAANILNAFSDTYAELSQSQTGLHIICKGNIPASVKTSQVEIYGAGRYCATTGLAVHTAEPTDKQQELDTLYQWIARRRDKGKATTGVCKPINAPTTARLTTVDAVIQKATHSRGGEIFTALFNGEWEGLGLGDGSQSSADMSFANRLCFWCGGDTDIMIDIFRQSGLYRNERKMMLAVNKALKNCACYYTGRV
jgi:putative DNA primase/helicase